MTTVLASAAVLAGAAFMLIAALGVARLPDLYTRMQAATKAAVVGVVAVLSGVAVAHSDASVTIRVVLISGFFLLTSPVAAHAIARSAHTRGVPLAKGTRTDPGARVGERRRSGERERPVGRGRMVRLAQPDGGETRRPPGEGGPADEVRS